MSESGAVQPGEQGTGEGSDATRRVRAMLERIAVGLDVPATVFVEEDGEEITARYEGADLGPLIGHHGQTIDAIQHLAFRAAFRGAGSRRRLSVDAAGYRERRASSLQATADQAAEAAVREGKPVVLEPMSASERRVVHEHLKERRDVETYSQGEEPDRRLVVAPLVR
jgi:spoIIIJ-associated protein